MDSNTHDAERQAAPLTTPQPPAPIYQQPQQPPAQHLPPHQNDTTQPPSTHDASFRPTRAFSIAKAVLRALDILTCIICVGLGAGLISVSTAFDSFITVIMVFCVAVAAFCWEVAEFITIAVRKKNFHGIHPGAHVGVHCVLWLIAMLTVVFMGISVGYESADYCIDDSSNSDYTSSYGGCYYSFDTQADANHYFGLYEALTAFAGILFILQFVLFIMACVETARRNKQRKRTVYLVAAPGPQGMYYYQLPSNAVVQQGPYPMQHQQPMQQNTLPLPQPTYQTGFDSMGQSGGRVAGPEQHALQPEMSQRMHESEGPPSQQVVDSSGSGVAHMGQAV